MVYSDPFFIPRAHPVLLRKPLRGAEAAGWYKSSSEWRKAGEIEKWRVEKFLREIEINCVAACDRFLNINYERDSIWLLEKKGAIEALLLYSRRTLFPVLAECREITLPPFLRRFLLNSNIGAIQGLQKDVDIMEKALFPLGYKITKKVNLYLMMYKNNSSITSNLYNNDELNIRPIKHSDYKALFEMQMDYEMEEVIVSKTRYSPLQAKASLTHIYENEKAFIAERAGKVVGKINTNARSFTRRQIGGVYVRPPFRGEGIAKRMVRSMVGALCDEGKGASLYVKKANKTAISVYNSEGFVNIADYSISYMEN